MRYLLALGVVLSGCAQAASPETASLAPTPAVSGSAEGRPTAQAPIRECSAMLSDRPLGSLAVVLADGERQGTAVVIQLSPDKIVGRLSLGYQPVVAVDPRNRQLIAICSTGDNSSTALVSYGLDDLGIRWRVPLAERIMTKVTAVQSVLPSVDGRFVFTYHYRTLLPGDGNAPGHTRYWIGVRDARTGALLREVDTPQCGVALFHQATPDLLYLGCALGGHLRAIRTDTWQEAMYFNTTSGIRLAELTEAGDRYVVVTHDLWVLTFDTKTGRQLSASHFSDTAQPVVPVFGRLGMRSDGNEVWVPTSAPSYEVIPGNAIARIDLDSGTRRDLAAVDVGAVAPVHGRVLFVAGGRLRTVGSSAELGLGVSHRVVGWWILAGP